MISWRCKPGGLNRFDRISALSQIQVKRKVKVLIRCGLQRRRFLRRCKHLDGWFGVTVQGDWRGRRRKRKQPPLQAHGFRTGAECGSGPPLILAGRDVANPDFKTGHGLHAKVAKIVAGRVLLCEPAVEHLLHGPRGLAKFIEPNHAGTALESVKGATQHRQLTDVARRVQQCGKRCLGLTRHLTRFFQENIAQIVFFKVGSSRKGIGRRRLRNGGRRSSGYQLCQRFRAGLLTVGASHSHSDSSITHSPGQNRLIRERRVGCKHIELDA